MTVAVAVVVPALIITAATLLRLTTEVKRIADAAEDLAGLIRLIRNDRNDPLG